MKLRDGGATIMLVLAAYWVVTDLFKKPPPPPVKECAFIKKMPEGDYVRHSAEYCKVFESP